MAGEIKSTALDVEALTVALKELGLITKHNEKTGGIFEKRQKKIKKQRLKIKN